MRCPACPSTPERRPPWEGITAASAAAPHSDTDTTPDLGRASRIRCLAAQEGGDRDGVDARGVQRAVLEMGHAEPVPAGRGPVVDRDEESGATCGQRNAKSAVRGFGQIVLPHPAAEQVLDGRGLGRGAGVGMLQQVGGGAVQLLGLLAADLLPGDRPAFRGELGLRVAGSARLEAVSVVGCGIGVQRGFLVG